MTPEISVIIPCFNAALTLERAVNSVLTQTGVDVEVILVDDCSTDGTLALAKGLAGSSYAFKTHVDIITEIVQRSHIVVIHHNENKRQGAALNTAMSHAKGDYILRLDQDDWLEPGSLLALKTTLDENPGAGFAYGAIQYHGRRSTLAKPKPFDPAQFYRHNASGYCYLFRRAVWDNGIRYPETGDFVNLGDWAHVLDMVSAGLVGIALPEVTVLNYVYGWTGTSSDLSAESGKALVAFKAKYPQVTAVTV